MGLMTWAEEKVKKLTFWDLGALKLALLVLGAIIGAYISVFVKQYVWWFVVVFVVLYLYLILKFFKK